MLTTNTLDLLHLFGKEQLNDIQNRLSKITKLGFVTVNYSGEPMTEYTGFCDFCSHFREHETLSKNCIASDAMSSIQAAITEKPLIYMCPCGLMEIAIPIIVGGAYLGGFLCGQARCSDAPEDIMRMKPAADLPAFQDMMKKAGSDQETLPMFDYQHFQNVADLVNLVITLLCENKISEITQEKALRDQIARSAFLEAQLQIFSRLLHETDYRQMLDAVPSFISGLFEQTEEKSERIRLMTSFVNHLNQAVERQDSIDSLKIFPLTSADLDTVAAAELWLAQILDCYYRGNKAKAFTVLENIFQYINQHLSEELTLSQIVNNCSISQSYLSRLFRNYFQVSVTDYIHLRKIHQAKRYMVQGKKSIGDIAFLLGYNEYTYFSKVFKKYENKTVQEYRKMIAG